MYAHTNQFIKLSLFSWPNNLKKQTDQNLADALTFLVCIVASLML